MAEQAAKSDGGKGPSLQYLDDLFKNGAARANYLIHWSAKHGYVYVETPKVACTTVKRVLQLAELDGDAEALPKQVHDRRASPIKRVSDDVGGFRKHIETPETFRFCFVRNPFTRALSCYLDKFVTNEWERNRLAPGLGLDPKVTPTFLDFLTAIREQKNGQRDIHWATQTFLLRPGRLAYDFIGRFESFHDDYTKVCRYLDLDRYLDLSSTAHATGADQKRLDYLGEQEIALLREIYREDFDNFGYGLTPRVI